MGPGSACAPLCVGRMCCSLHGPFGATKLGAPGAASVSLWLGLTRATIPAHMSPSMADHLHVGGGREYADVGGN